jgi:hypothetical protein
MILSIWSDFFEVSEPTPNKQQLYTSRQTPSVSSVYILDCLFNDFTSTSGSGGALYCNTSVTYLLVESSSFFSCKANSQGGAIYFSNSGGQSVLHKVCGYDCCTISSYYQFAYISVNNIISSKNYFNHSSISRCVKSNAYYMLRLDNGKVCCLSINMSMNNCYRFSALVCYPFCDSSSVTCYSLYSSFTDNNASESICIKFYQSGANFEIKRCNILRNIQASLGSWGTIEGGGSLTIEDSCILENIATYIFCASIGKITVLNCTIDKATGNNNVLIQNTATKSFIHALNHMSTRNCFVEYDSVGTLTPIIPPSSPSKKQIHYTCKCQQRNFVSLTNVLILIFNFINPYVSGW